MIELYHADMSTCAQKVRLTLANKGLAWESHLFNLRHRDQHRVGHAPEYLLGIGPQQAQIEDPEKVADSGENKRRTGKGEGHRIAHNDQPAGHGKQRDRQKSGEWPTNAWF